jgi:Ni/Fe-hydrogenase subunit HybB-like protein
MKGYAVFLWRCFRVSFVGDWRYHAWMFALTVLILLGINAYCKQVVHGLIVTGMTDHVSWGLYIANFTFLVGVAAAAVMLVIPVYIYRNRELHDLVIFGELLAVAAIIMCMLFVTVDMGRPDRLHHMMLRFNFPASMLTWDVLVLNGYLALNLHICGYLIWCAYHRRTPSKLFYIPFVFTAIVWAVSIHTVTAFLYSGLGSRPLWNQSILAPRFIASAFASGPAIIIITLQVIGRYTSYEVPRAALMFLRQVVIIALTISMFLLISELFTEFYTDSAHLASTQYLFFGLHGHHALVPWIWTALAFNTIALVILYLPLSRSLNYLNIACLLLIVGLWIEKGMGLIVPAFIPSPIGEIVEYTPTLNETLVSLGIWAFGLLLYTIFVRVTVPVLSGKLTADRTTEEIESDLTFDIENGRSHAEPAEFAAQSPGGAAHHADAPVYHSAHGEP